MDSRYLFRAKSIDTGEWVIGSPINLEIADSDDVGAYIVPKYPTVRHEKELTFNLAFNACKVISDTVGHCTGMTEQRPPYDKYIFEDDIAETYWYEGENLITDIMVVQYVDGAFMGLSTTNHSPRPLNDMVERGCRILGNVYDNPELIGGSKVDNEVFNTEIDITAKCEDMIQGAKRIIDDYLKVVTDGREPPIEVCLAYDVKNYLAQIMQNPELLKAVTT